MSLRAWEETGYRGNEMAPWENWRERDKGVEKLYILIALLVYKMMNGKERRKERMNKNGSQKKQ